MNSTIIFTPLHYFLRRFRALFVTLFVLTAVLTGCSANFEQKSNTVSETTATTSNIDNTLDLSTFDISEAGSYAGSPYVALHNNIPYFTEEEKNRTDAFENYSDLDSLGRCQTAFANICKELMPTEERGKIGSVKPSGWHSAKYEIVDGKYLYNRCHLIGFQLAGENANEKNLITGTRYLNIEGMLPFENMVADYVKETKNHVLYRVTPVFEGNNLVASGVLMEGYSVEDHGDGILFCIYAYNVQPGITIDYATGESSLGDSTISDESSVQSSTTTYIINTNTGKFHKPSCSSVEKTNTKNKLETTESRDSLIAQGYVPCQNCNP